jgi:hypothetical protein
LRIAEKEPERERPGPPGGREEDHHHHQGVYQGGQHPGEEGHDIHHHHHQDLGEEGVQGNKAVLTACRNGMPETPSQASPGGTSPRTIKNDQINNTFKFEVTKQQHLLGGLARDEEEGGQEETWVREAKEEDNERYRNFLKYM